MTYKWQERTDDRLRFKRLAQIDRQNVLVGPKSEQTVVRARWARAKNIKAGAGAQPPRRFSWEVEQ